MQGLKGILGHFAELWMARPFSCLLIFALGGVFAFGYSYVPLHAAKQRRVERLESELASEAGRGLALAERLAEIELEARLAPESDEVQTLRSEKNEANRELAGLEKELTSARKRITRLERERSKYKKDAGNYKKAVKELTSERDALLAAEKRREQAPPVAAVAPTASPSPAMAGTRPPAPLAVPSPPELGEEPPRRITPDDF